MKKSIHLAVFSAVLLAAPAAFSQLTTIIDTTATGAVNDGTIGAAEYGSQTYFSSGSGSGFGNVIGSNSKLFLDSTSAGALTIGLQLGGGSLSDRGVIYFDSVSGGFTGTGAINDNSDPGRAAISGNGTGSGTSELTFAPGFSADYAIAFEGSGANLFQLSSGGAGSLVFLKSVNLTPNANNTDQQREMDLLLSDLGIATGGAFKYVATYLNTDNAFRSNELNGQGTTPGANIEANPFTFDNYNEFQSVPEPTTLVLLGLSGLAFLISARRRS